ncbi:hypothetical protein [Flavobacterium luminosum]|uniref:Lipoprotein n=1 Tax=Flavobacterium luminosum TaxID=2949086 RepID=A0ABT0TQ14_9FLAO|nr:hypothetical protein [Flavobacterium sp. HXWNR70]MCL9809584.1 hypothetical protein [Flavobacterium sp. HXWNR70]
MKKFVFLCLIFLSVSSCGLWDDDSVPYHGEILPVESAVLPTEFKKDSVYELPIRYVRPTTCYLFDGFYYQKDLNVRVVAIYTTVFEQKGCVPPTTNPVTEILKFKPTTESSYIFKFWKGKDTQGQNIFEEVEVPVVP